MDFGEFQNRFRPMKNGSPSFETVCNNARIFSDSDCEFVIRSCVFQDNAAHLPQWAEWIGNNLLPSMVCFEPMTKISGIAKKMKFFQQNLLICAKFLHCI
jgi:sulfatase maturation enzyme AslB (radical SAM superfamily)